jgi:hypothetical protein
MFSTTTQAYHNPMCELTQSTQFFSCNRTEQCCNKPQPFKHLMSITWNVSRICSIATFRMCVWVSCSFVSAELTFLYHFFNHENQWHSRSDGDVIGELTAGYKLSWWAHKVVRLPHSARGNKNQRLISTSSLGCNVENTGNRSAFYCLTWARS